MAEGDLVVDYRELEQSQKDLESINREFEHASDRVSSNEDIWSNGDVCDAMSSFADNWKDSRESLLGKMSDAHKHTGACLIHFEGTEQSLANSLNTHHGGAHAGAD